MWLSVTKTLHRQIKNESEPHKIWALKQALFSFTFSKALQYNSRTFHLSARDCATEAAVRVPRTEMSYPDKGNKLKAYNTPSSFLSSGVQKSLGEPTGREVELISVITGDLRAWPTWQISKRLYHFAKASRISKRPIQSSHSNHTSQRIYTGKHKYILEHTRVCLEDRRLATKLKLWKPSFPLFLWCSSILTHDFKSGSRSIKEQGVTRNRMTHETIWILKHPSLLSLFNGMLWPWNMKCVD